MNADQAGEKYRIALTELERSAKVPIDQQNTLLDEPPGESPVSPDSLNRMKLLGIAGDGRW